MEYTKDNTLLTFLFVFFTLCNRFIYIYIELKCWICKPYVTVITILPAYVYSSYFDRRETKTY